jgi:hypothetical protein
MKRFLATLLIAMLALISCDSNSSSGNDDDQLPIVGNWVSEGSDVAPLLVSLGISKIEAQFNDDNTYTVLSYDAAMASTTLSGTWVAEKSDVDNIYTLTVNQTAPTALTSEGIFEVYSASPDSMYYEIVQTEPAIGATPPTPADGFGSTNGGALGTINIQKYLKSE